MTALPLLFVAILGASASPPEPAVRLFDAALSVGADGVIDITERIHFGAGAVLEREIPTRRLLWSGLREVSRIELVNAILDGEPVAVRSRATPRGVVWTLEEPREKGEHSLLLRYRQDARVRPGAAADLLVWDATGFRRDISIESVRVSIEKPETAAEFNYSILRGKPGALVDIERSNAHASVSWKGAQALPPGEGLRVILRLPPGAVPTGAPRNLDRMLRDNLHIALGFFGSAALALFIFLEHLALNRDPDPGARIDGPGADLSYGSARFIVDGAYSGRALQAAIAGLAAKRWLSQVGEKDGRWTLARGQSDDAVLTADERVLATALLGGKREAAFTGTAALEPAIAEHSRAIEGMWAPLLRARAWPQWACAVAWSAGIVSAMRAAAVLFEPVPISLPYALLAGALCALGGAGLICVWTLTYKAWRAASLPRGDGKTRMLPLLAAVGLGFLSFGLVTAAAGAFQTAIGDLAPAALLAAFCLLLVNWIGFYALRGPTPEGFDALRRARLLVKRDEEKSFSAIFAAADSLARAVDGRI